MQSLPTEDSPIFMAPNLNNIPCVDLRNVDGANLVCRQDHLSKLVEQLMKEQKLMREQLSNIDKKLSIEPCTNAPSSGSVKPKAGGRGYAETV